MEETDATHSKCCTQYVPCDTQTALPLTTLQIPPLPQILKLHGLVGVATTTNTITDEKSSNEQVQTFHHVPKYVPVL
jgi:hypothetical protein